MFDMLKAPGRVDVILERLNYSAGETVKGKAVLTMDQPKDAKGLRLEFWAEKKVYHRDSHGRRTQRTERTYEYKADLDGERAYSGVREYPFELNIPAKNDPQMPEGALGGIAKTFMLLTQSTLANRPSEWYISVSLDIPQAVDVNKRVQINVN